MDDIYRENIMDHYKYPRNFGRLPKATVSAREHVVSCGDDLTVELLVKNNSIDDVRFQGTGCAISIASASMLSEKIIGSKISDLKQMQTDDMVSLLGITLTPTRLKCALLSLEVVHKAIYTYGKI